jgi:RimJ/RimL family protein N-acetyltransferase
MTDVEKSAPSPASPAPTAAAVPCLTTARLRLRGLRPKDAAQIALHASDWKVARMTERIPHPYPPGSAEALVDRLAAGPGEEIVWAIDSGEDDGNGLVGMVALRFEPDGAGRIGYWIAPALWGAGYAGEAVEAVKAFAADAGMPALVARVFQDNLASVRVLTRAGFEFTGEGEAYSLARGGMVPVFRYRWEPAR